MKFKNAIKKIAALGTGVTMLGATLMGAMAADLADYPNMFMKDDKFNAVVVVGDNALPIDIVGAIDMAFSLQYEATEDQEISIEGDTTVSASAGVEVASTGDHLTLMEALSGVETSFKEDDMTTLLADGVVTDDSESDDYDYTQELELSADTVLFDLPDDEIFGTNPALYLDHTTDEAYVLDVTIDTINLTLLDDSESITMLGRTFTFDPDMAFGDTAIVLYASEKTDTIGLGPENAKSVELDDGTKLDLEVIGANTDGSTATLRVNGKSYTVESGDTVNTAGTSLYINDVFTYNVPAPGATVEYFVGSDKVELTTGGAWEEIEVDGDTLSGYEAKITGAIGAVTKMEFRVTPSDIDAEDDQFEYLLVGESLVDPFFKTLKMEFAGPTPGLMSEEKTPITFDRKGDDLVLNFVNRDDEAYELALFSQGTDDVDRHEKWAGETLNVSRSIPYFILQEGDSAPFVTKIFKLKSVTTDEVKIVDLTDNTEKTYDVAGEEIGSTGINISDWDAGTDTILLDDNTSLQVWTQYDGLLTFTADPDNESNDDVVFTEYSDNFDDLAAGDALSLTLNVTYHADDKLDLALAKTANDFDAADDEDGDNEYGISKFGTYWELEKENNGEFLNIYYPEEEVTYHVFFTPTEAVISTTAGGDTVTSTVVNRINVGAAKLASEITDVTAQNLIVVGGPCVNKVASELLSFPEPCATGFNEGEAVIKLIENGDNVAVLVAGWSGEDTRKATTVLSKYDMYATELVGEEVVVTGATLAGIEVNAPTTE